MHVHYSSDTKMDIETNAAVCCGALILEETILQHQVKSPSQF